MKLYPSLAIFSAMAFSDVAKGTTWTYTEDSYSGTTGVNARISYQSTFELTRSATIDVQEGPDDTFTIVSTTTWHMHYIDVESFDDDSFPSWFIFEWDEGYGYQYLQFYPGNEVVHYSDWHQTS